MNLWVQETLLAGTRQAIVHHEDCPICTKRITKGSSDDLWFGPVITVEAARDVSYGRWGVSMRSECRCVRAAMVENAAANEAKAVAKKAKEVAALKAGKNVGAKSSPVSRYSAMATAAVAILTVSLFVFPALSVVEAGSPSASPFLLTNNSPIPLTDVRAECSVELHPAAIHLQDVHQQLAGRMDSKNRVTIPCFQNSGGAVPQTNGVTVHVTVKYAVFGIRHVQQTFSFVAARNSQGFCHWVYKS